MIELRILPFTIFHRLNTGGVKLNNQEIRNCIFYGKFNNLLKELAKDIDFLKIYKLPPGTKDRFQYEEKILRFIAFSKIFNIYNGRLAKFLNDYMESNRYIDEGESDLIKSEFIKVHKLIVEGIELPKHFNSSSKAIHEALYVGILKNYKSCVNKTKDELNIAFNTFIEDPLFSTVSLKEGLSQREKVIDRLNRAIEIFK